MSAIFAVAFDSRISILENSQLSLKILVILLEERDGTQHPMPRTLQLKMEVS